jgi:hypothetical protein
VVQAKSAAIEKRWKGEIERGRKIKANGACIYNTYPEMNGWKKSGFVVVKDHIIRPLIRKFPQAPGFD